MYICSVSFVLPHCRIRRDRKDLGSTNSPVDSLNISLLAGYLDILSTPSNISSFNIASVNPVCDKDALPLVDTSYLISNPR